MLHTFVHRCVNGTGYDVCIVHKYYAYLSLFMWSFLSLTFCGWQHRKAFNDYTFKAHLYPSYGM